MSFMLALPLAVFFLSGLGTTAQAASTYTITLLSTLDIQEDRGHELSGGISANGSLDIGATLLITASSDNGFKFVKSGDAAQTISYDFRAGSSDTTAITMWAFASLTSTDTTDTAGIDVEDYSDKPGGTYIKTVTYKAEMMSSGYTA